jgi:hypothetical protein
MRGRRGVATRAVTVGLLVVACTVGVTAAPAGAKKSAKKATVTITGDFKVKNAASSRCGQLSKPVPGAATRTIFLTAPPTKKAPPGGGSFEFDFNVVPLGATTTFPAASTGNPSTTPSLRFSYNENSDYLDWGGTAAAGTLTIDAAGKTGTIDLQLPFVGDDARKVAATAHQPVHLKGKFNCPAGP